MIQSCLSVVIAPRGVRLADYTIDGHRVLEAISSRGERVTYIALEDDAFEAVVQEWLWGFLDGFDPQPQLLRSA